MLKRLFPLALVMVVLTGCQPKSADSPMDQFVTRLMSQMTMEEKLGQLNLPVSGDIVTGVPRESNVAQDIREGKVGGLFNLKGADRIREIQRIAVEESRLGIPLLFGMDVIHGYETIFPLPIAMACSWDLDAITEAAHIAALEAGADGINWTFSPMVDICHDGRWGRISEGSGEDPYLGARIAEAYIRGYQGQDLSADTTILACVKHFALYGAVQAGREYNYVSMDSYRMYNEYFEPYEAAVKAGAGSFMAAFNTINGVPCHGSHWLLTDVLRKQWGYQGFVVGDYCGLEQLQDHGVQTDIVSAAIQSISAGLDMDMVSGGPLVLADAVRDGRISRKIIDTACRRILEAKYRLGLFSDPYRYCDPERRSVILCDEHRATARRIATESMVLLKNDASLLPLAKKGTIALIGPLVEARTNMSGTWSVAAVHDRYKTLAEGLSDALKGTPAKLLIAKGCNLTHSEELEARATMFGKAIRDPRSTETLRQQALTIARQADVIILAMGEGAEMSGECASRVNLDMPDAQHELMAELVKLHKPIVLLHFSGRPTVLNWETEHIPAIVQTWFAGSETGDAVADILFGKVNPSGHLCVQMPRHVGQYPFSYRQFRSSRPNDGGGFGKYSTCYIDELSTPLYPFGYGLSYTSFEYSPVTLSDSTLSSEDTLTASITLTNTGSRLGTEVVQLYICDRVAEGVRPYKELRGFERVSLAAGESKTISFLINRDRLAYYAPSAIEAALPCQPIHRTIDPGIVDIFIGPNAATSNSASLSFQ